MYRIFSRKTLLLITLWGSALSLFPQTQAFSCWKCCFFPCCPQTHSTTPTVKSRLLNPEGGSKNNGYEINGSQPTSLAQQPPRQEPFQPLTEKSPVIVSATVSATPLPSSSSSKTNDELVVPLLLPTVSSSLNQSFEDTDTSPEWSRPNGELPSNPSEVNWCVGTAEFGDERLPLVKASERTKAKFKSVKKNEWETIRAREGEKLTKLFFLQTSHYAPEKEQAFVRVFLTKIIPLWEKAPDSFSFAWLPTDTSYYFFARQSERLLYIRMPRDQNREKVLEDTRATRDSSRGVSRTASRAVSRMGSRAPSPKQDEKTSTVKTITRK